MDNEHENIPGEQENTGTAVSQNITPASEETAPAGVAAPEKEAEKEPEKVVEKVVEKVPEETAAQVPQGNTGYPQGDPYQYQQNPNQQNGYQQNGYQNPYNTTGYNPNYTQNYNEEGMDTKPLSMGEWALTILALMLPCCAGFILYIVWAFSKRGNINRRNYCRAALIIIGAAVVIYLVVFMLFGSVLFGSVATQMNILAR